MSDARIAFRPVAVLAILALLACAVVLVTGMATSLVYTEAEPWIRGLGITLQHLRPIHETFAFAWVFLGGAAVVHMWLLQTGGPLRGAERLRFTAQVALWSAAGVGILVSLLAGRFSGREYAGYHPVFSAMILAGWLLFAWNFVGRSGLSLRGRPVYVYMWITALPLFVISFAEAHAYLIQSISHQPLWDLRIQWKSGGVLVGSFNQMAYGAMMYAACRMKGDDSYAHSRTAWAMFVVGVANTFANYGHHTYHTPQTPWIHWIAFVVSMTEVVILAKLWFDLWRLLRRGPAAPDLALPLRFAASVTGWTFFMLGLAMLISVPPLNVFAHGTHVVVAHVMGAMIGIDSMILWAGLAWALRVLVGPDHAVVRSAALRRSVTLVDLLLALFLCVFLVRGTAAGLTQTLGPEAPDWSLWVSRFPNAMAVLGHALALVCLWIVGRLGVAFVTTLRARAVAPVAVPRREQQPAGEELPVEAG
jgi:nitric oxide reductase subunit B